MRQKRLLELQKARQLQDSLEEKLTKLRKPVTIEVDTLVGFDDCREHRKPVKIVQDWVYMLLHPEEIDINKILALLTEFRESLMNEMSFETDMNSPTYKNLMTNLKQTQKVEQTFNTLCTNGVKVSQIVDCLIPLVPNAYKSKVERIYDTMVKDRSNNSHMNLVGNMILVRQGVTHVLPNQINNKVIKGGTVRQALDMIHAQPNHQNEHQASGKKRGKKGQKQPQQQQQQSQQQPKSKKAKKDASAGNDSKKPKLPENFVAGISDKPLYPNLNAAKPDLKWCINHHWCTHTTEQCNTPDSGTALIKKGIKK